MNRSPWRGRGVWLVVILAVLCAPSAAQATTVYYWTVDATWSSAPTNDLHLHFQIAPQPFEFGGVVVTDQDNYATGAGTVPGPGGSFDVNFDGATPDYAPGAPIHVEFNFTSNQNVTLVSATWTYDGATVGVSNSLPGATVVTQEDVPEPSTLALAILGLAGLGFVVLRRKHCHA